MGAVFDIVAIMAVLTWLLNLAASGRISVEVAALGMVGLVACIAVGRAKGIKAARVIVRIALPLVSLWALIEHYGGGAPTGMASIFASVATLAVVLLGIYIMFRGVAKK